MIKNAPRQCRTILPLAAAFILTTCCTGPTLFAQTAPKKTVSASVEYKQGITIKKEQTVVLPDGRVVYNNTEQMPEYPGDLQPFLVNNLRYPEAARKKKIEGRSIVRFIVSQDGRVTDAEIVRSSGNELLDNESLRVVASMEGWKPGMKDGHPVSVYYTLPITYKLD